jgi:hypothetical protein
MKKWLSDRLVELAHAAHEKSPLPDWRDSFGESGLPPDNIVLGALIQALDEYQATVEDRLNEIEEHPALSVPRLGRYQSLAMDTPDPGLSRYEQEVDEENKQ